MPTREIVYEAALRGALPALRLAAPLHPKLRRAVAGWTGAAAELAAWAAASRAPGRPLVWVHAPSVGEALMAQAIVGALRQRRPDLQIAFTFFSASAERMAARVGADVAAYLPWDVRALARGVLAAIRPDVIAFVRTEIWPGLSREARAQGTRLALVNAVLAEGSSRLGRGSRFLLGPAYGRLHAVGAVAAPDAGRFPRLGVSPARIRVTGDARFDQVWARVGARGREAARQGSPLLQRLHDPGVPTLVAGSTWPADEARLVPAFARAATGRPLRLIVAPHEPTEAHLHGVERALDAAGIAHARLAAVEADAAPLPAAVVVDRVGILADLYAIADMAYVGGGFGSDGLHSVVEPAALGVPTLFGPRHGNAREAEALAEAGGGSVVQDEGGIAARIARLADDRAYREAVGAAALAFVQGQLGGADANAALIEELLEVPVRA